MNKNLLDLLSLNQAFTQQEQHLKHKIIYLNSVFLLAALIAFAMGFYRWQISPVMGVIDFGFSGISFALLYYLKKHRDKVELISTIAISLSFALFYVIYLFAPYQTTRLSLFFLLSAAAFFLKGLRSGVLWLLLIISAIVAAHFIPSIKTGYSGIDLITTCLYLIALFLIFWNYEMLQQGQSKREQEQRLQGLIDERWRLALESAGDAIWDWDIQLDRFIFSKSYADMLGYTENEISHTASHHESLLHPDDKSRATSHLNAYLEGNISGQYVSEQRLRCKDGSYKWVLCRGRVMQFDSHGRPRRMLGTLVDLTERKEHEKQLEHIAHYDALTGVPNRVLLADRLSQALARTKRDRGLMAVCYLDLDGFKPVNDNFGHEIGDKVLVEVTRRIKENIREDDTVARLGGDEFVVLLVGLQVPEECVSSLHRLLEAINRPIEVKENSIRISASIGVSLYPEDEQDPDTLLRHADQAMYIAKQSGKNRYHLYDAANDLRARSHHELLQHIRHGLAHGEFELYYQPQVEMRTRRMVGAEALIRWHHPQRGLLLPGEFLRVIENTELEIELGDWVVASSFEQLRLWRKAGHDFDVSINISAYHLQSADFVSKLQRMMQHCCPQPCHRCLQIEVLETAALEDIIGVSAIIKSCREFGVGFALDDFGTGYSSLTYLSNLDVDTLKIDQSFVRDMLQEKGDHAIVLGIIALARAFDRGVVAEGVETDAHYRALLQMGCEVGQGVAIAPPRTAAELIEWSQT